MPRHNLTTNACIVCRKKRTKCDGRQPCRRCVLRGEDCAYEDKMWRTKDHLRSEIERLRKEVQQCQDLIKALTLGGPGEEWNSIQSRMHRGEPPERIAAWIISKSPTVSHRTDLPSDTREHQTAPPAISDTFPSPATISRPSPCRTADRETADSLPSSPEDTYFTEDCGMVSPAISLGSSDSVGCSSSHTRSSAIEHTPAAPRSLSSWTGVTQDIPLIRRLLSHYFEHCFPGFSFVCKEQFMDDLEQGTGVHCSAALVNAILGFASQSYHTSSNIGSPQSCLSRRFLAQANELLKPGRSRLGIPLIQATGVLALAEINVGNNESALQLALDNVRNAILWRMKMDSSGNEEEYGLPEARATTYCGALTMVRIFRVLTGRLSCQTGPLFMRLTPEEVDSTSDSPAARVERGLVLQQHFFNQLDGCPELVRLVNTVTEVAHTFCSYFHDGGITPADLIPAYDKCLRAWERFNAWLPKGSETDKDILFAQIWYNYILTVLFTTLADSPVDLRNGITPKAVVIPASETVIFLTKVYQDHCGFLSVHPLLPHMVFAASLVQLKRAFVDDIGQQAMVEGSEKNGSPLRPQAHARGRMDGAGNVPLREGSRRRSASEIYDSHPLAYPSWKQHVAAATMLKVNTPNKLHGHGDNNGTSVFPWPPKTSAKLAAEGTVYLTKMGETYPKATELARLLRARSAAPPSAPTLATGAPPELWMPGWGTVSWGFGAGFGGLGVDNLQGFAAALTASSHPVGGVGGGGDGGSGGVGVVPEAESGYAAEGESSSAVDKAQGQESTCGIAYSSLYDIDPGSLTQVDCGDGFDGYGPPRLDGLRVSSFAGGLPSQGEEENDLS